jgi:hypothetical protein
VYYINARNAYHMKLKSRCICVRKGTYLFSSDLEVRMYEAWFKFSISVPKQGYIVVLVSSHCGINSTPQAM